VRPDEISERLRALTGSFTESLGFAPHLQTEGPLDGLGPALAAEVLAVAREGLSNAAKYAGAARVDVAVTVDDGSVCVVVVDDGHGVDPATASGGLVNLAERAAARDGTFEISPGTPKGTRLRWRVPR
jgi:signal transduction histidine kinase